MDFGTKRLLQGLGLGYLATLASPYVLPIAAAILRPLVKGLLKQGFLAVEAGREGLAHALEALEDTIAEVRAEVEEELSQRKPRSEPEASAETAHGEKHESKPAMSTASTAHGSA